MKEFKDLNRICKYPTCACTQDDNCSTRLLKQMPIVPIWSRIFMAACMLIIILLSMSLVGCTSKAYCPTYSSATYNAKQPHYPGKFNPVRH